MLSSRVIVPSQRRFLVGGLASIAISVLVLMLSVWQMPDQTAPATIPTSQPTAVVAVSVPQFTRESTTDWSLGKPTAPIVLDLYTDLTCSHCRDLHLAMESKGFLSQFIDSGDVYLRIHMLAMPEVSPWSVDVTVMSVCAGSQGQFWPAYDALMRDATWLTAPNPRQQAQTQVLQATTLDRQAFEACFQRPDFGREIVAFSRWQVANGLAGTPSAYVNGHAVVWRSNPIDDLITAIQQWLPEPATPQRRDPGGSLQQQY